MSGEVRRGTEPGGEPVDVGESAGENDAENGGPAAVGEETAREGERGECVGGGVHG